MWRENAPGNKVLDVVVFEGPDVFAEFGRVSTFSVAEWCGVVSVSCFEVVLCESYVRFCRVVVFACDGGLVNYWWLQAVSVERACVLMSAVACLVIRELKHLTFSTGRRQPEVKFTSDPRFPPTESTVATLRRLCFAYFDVACKTWVSLLWFSCFYIILPAMFCT